MLQFNDTTTYRGIVQQYEEEIGATLGDISSSTTKLKQLTAKVNLALDDFTKLAINASGSFQWDDSNHTDYPTIKANIASGTRDYPYTTDEGGNLILDIHKVAILTSATATDYQEISPVDVQSEDIAAQFNNSQTGVPTGYDKTGNGIIFNIIPNYSATLGLLLYINREASYFTSSDTTKKAGIPAIFHRYLVLRPAEDHARRNALPNYTALRAERLAMEADIKEYFGLREKDVRKVMTPKRISYI